MAFKTAIPAIALAAAALGFSASAQETPPPLGAAQSPPPTNQAAAGSQPNASSWSAEVDAARARHDDWLACIQAKRFKCDDRAKADPMEALLNDDTLVEGDIVATREGLKVFRGQPGTPHRREDFR